MSKKEIKLAPGAFSVNENGEVVLNDAQLAEALKDSNDDGTTGEQGVVISVSF